MIKKRFLRSLKPYLSIQPTLLEDKKVREREHTHKHHLWNPLFCHSFAQSCYVRTARSGRRASVCSHQWKQKLQQCPFIKFNRDVLSAHVYEKEKQKTTTNALWFLWSRCISAFVCVYPLPQIHDSEEMNCNSSYKEICYKSVNLKML